MEQSLGFAHFLTHADGVARFILALLLLERVGLAEAALIEAAEQQGMDRIEELKRRIESLEKAVPTGVKLEPGRKESPTGRVQPSAKPQLTEAVPPKLRGKTESGGQLEKAEPPEQPKPPKTPETPRSSEASDPPRTPDSESVPCA